MGSADVTYGAPEDAAPSLVPAVDITFSRPSATVKGAAHAQRFRHLRERGHLLLSRAASRSRKPGRQDRSALPSNSGSSATALHTAEPPSASVAASIAPATPQQLPAKGPVDFRVQALRDAAAVAVAPAAPAAFSSSMPAMSRRDIEAAAAPGSATAASPPPPQQQPQRRQRGPKLIRNPNNTSHRPRSHPSRFSQSMDFMRPRNSTSAATAAAAGAPRSARPLSHLLACCSPALLFRRGPSYGSMRSDATRPAAQPQRQRGAADADAAAAATQDQAAAEEEEQAEGDGRQSPQLQLQHSLLPRLVRGGSPLPPHARASVTDTAVAVGSLDDHTTASSKRSSDRSNGPKHVGATDDTDDAAESDWLVPRPGRDQSQGRGSLDTDSYTSPGSGLPGLSSGSAMPVPGNTSTAAAAQHASDLDTDPGISTPGDSFYRTPPTSIGDNMPAAAAAAAAAAAGSSVATGADAGSDQPSDTPANTMTKLYLGDEAYEHVPRRLTVESSVVDPAESLDEDPELRAELTSPPNNIVSASSERLVTHVDSQALLPPLPPPLKGRKCLVLDLDETLVHSSFREVDQPDYVVPVVLEGQEHSVYVVKRPGVDEFINIVGQYYEVVVFTASLSMYADPVLDLLDKNRAVHHRLFRESCDLYNGNYVKDLSRLGRDITQSIIIDNSPASYAFHPNNAIGISTWLNDPMDTELRDLIPFLIDLTQVDDVSAVLSLTHNQTASFAQE